jgi:hypothetical protein
MKYLKTHRKVHLITAHDAYPFNVYVLAVCKGGVSLLSTTHTEYKRSIC